MARFSTREAAKRLGVSYDTLAHYVEVGKVPAPEVIRVGKGKRVVHAWTEAEIEHVRQLLPKIANGRKTRYSKLRETQKPQPEAVARKTKKKGKTRPAKS
jgi:excisionase family DNA binding protein